MFGKENEKEEDWEYISAEDYFDENEYGRIMTEKDKKEKVIKNNSNTEFLEELFRPHLMRDEQLLCVIGSGKGDNESPFENEKSQKVGKKIAIVRNVLVSMFIIGVLLAVFGKQGLIGTFMILPLIIISYLLPVVLVVGVALLIIWGIKGAPKSMNYAVTNKRIISYGYQYFQSIRLREITDVSVRMKDNNTGKITVRAKGTGIDSSLYSILNIPSVNDPFRVKMIIEKAKEEILRNPSDDPFSCQPEYVPQRPSAPHKPDVPLTMYDKKIRTPYNSRSSDNMND